MCQMIKHFVAVKQIKAAKFEPQAIPAPKGSFARPYLSVHHVREGYNNRDVFDGVFLCYW